jgi:hypothetical protein
LWAIEHVSGVIQGHQEEKIRRNEERKRKGFVGDVEKSRPKFRAETPIRFEIIFKVTHLCRCRRPVTMYKIRTSGVD